MAKENKNNYSTLFNEYSIELGFKGLVEVHTKKFAPKMRQVETLTILAKSLGIEVQTRLIRQFRNKYDQNRVVTRYANNITVYYIKN